MRSSGIYIARCFMLIFLCILLGACSMTETKPNPLIISPIHSETVTETNTPSKASTLTQSSTPSLTISPSASATLSNEKIQATESEQAFAIYETKVAEFNAGCDGPSSISSLGNWVAVSCSYDRGQTLEIVNKNEGRWILHPKDLMAKNGFGTTSDTWEGELNPYHWTKDEKYLFFTYYIPYDEGGTCFYGYGVHGLYRINLTDGSVSTVLPFSTIEGYQISFSPTGRRMAYQDLSSGPPKILDLRTGEEIAIKSGGGFSGNPTWSPDGTELAYGTCVMTPDFTTDRSAIKIFNTKTRSSRTILELEKNFLTIEEWIDGNIIKIKSEDDQTGDASYVYIEVASQELVSATPTP